MKKIVSKDSEQVGYTYELTEPIGKNFHPEFKPQLTPKEMLELGVFGGKYFTGTSKDEFPKDWFENAKLSDEKDKNLNFFETDASKPRQYWIDKGWMHPDDPRGWVQWYFRYYLGRRGEDDERQIKRWKNFIRHVKAIQNNCQKGDFACRPRQRQAVLHWAYDPRKL